MLSTIYKSKNNFKKKTKECSYLDDFVALVSAHLQLE